MNSINIHQLKVIFRRIIEKLETEIGDDGELELKTTIYREIPTDRWNKFDKPDDWYSEINISQGDLSDDLIELKKLVDDPERPCTYVDFDRLAAVLREISQLQNPSES